MLPLPRPGPRARLRAAQRGHGRRRPLRQQRHLRLTPPDHPQLGLLLRLAYQHWTLAVEAALHDAGFGDIRPPHANVFTFVPPEGIQVSELTRLGRVRKQTMAQVVEELEQLGYVERRPDPRDRRARLVVLTPRGESVRPVAMDAGRRVAARWAELTSPQHIDSLEASLQELLSKLRNDTER